MRCSLTAGASSTGRGLNRKGAERIRTAGSSRTPETKKSLQTNYLRRDGTGEVLPSWLNVVRLSESTLDHRRVRSLGGVRERRRGLAADNRGGLVNQFVVV